MDPRQMSVFFLKQIIKNNNNYKKKKSVRLKRRKLCGVFNKKTVKLILFFYFRFLQWKQKLGK